jgi:hypothetical protein
VSAAATLDLQQQILETLVSYKHDPLRFSLYAYPWKQPGDLVRFNGPYKWQTEVFMLIGKHLKNPATRYTPLRIAIASGNGIGKSAFISMLDNWAMSTCADCKVIVTAGTGAQLKTKTHPEIAKWYRLSINSDWFDVKAQSITAKDPKHANEWRTDLLPWDAQNPDAFSGLHNVNKRIVVIYDEASAIDPVIWDRTSGALTDEATEIIWIVLGNPTSNQGRFAECFGSDKYRWRTYQIDSRTVEGTNKEELAQEVEKYGEDSDYIRWRIRGEFPRAGSSQFISGALVAAARNYKSRGHEVMPRVLSCDVARFGDDQTVVGLRQGRKFEVLGKYRGKDTAQTADLLVTFIVKFDPEAIVIDGDGIGGGVIDSLRALGYKQPRYNLFEFHGGAEPEDGNQFFNKRAEVWGWMKAWLENGAELPNDPELDRQLTGPEFFIARGKTHHGSIALEHKDDMKKRGLESPDCADCLAMSFGVKVAPRIKQPYVAPRQVTSWS